MHNRTHSILFHCRARFAKPSPSFDARQIEFSIGVGILTGLLCAGCVAPGQRWDTPINVRAYHEFQHLAWQVPEEVDCLGDMVTLSVHGMFETNTYTVVIPEAESPLTQAQHVLSVNGSAAQHIGSLTGVCFQAYSLLHFSQGDCLLLHDRVTYVGGSGHEFQNTFLMLNRGRIVILCSDKGGSDFGERTFDRVRSRVAVSGRKIFVQQRHATFNDWWDATEPGKPQKRLIEEGLDQRTYFTEMSD